MVDMTDLKSVEHKIARVGSTPTSGTFIINLKIQAGVAERGVYSLKTSRILERGCIRNGHRVGNQPYLRHLNLDLQLTRLEQLTHNQQVIGSIPIWSTKTKAGVAHLVELRPSKSEVAGSNPVTRSVGYCEQAARRIDVFHSQTQSLIWLGLLFGGVTVAQLFLVQLVLVRIQPE